MLSPISSIRWRHITARSSGFAPATPRIASWSPLRHSPKQPRACCKGLVKRSHGSRAQYGKSRRAGTFCGALPHGTRVRSDPARSKRFRGAGRLLPVSVYRDASGDRGGRSGLRASIDTNFPRAPLARQEGLNAGFAFPVILDSEVLGIVELFNREEQPEDPE